MDHVVQIGPQKVLVMTGEDEKCHDWIRSHLPSTVIPQRRTWLAAEGSRHEIRKNAPKL
ncbi:MAG: hypothetical protein V4719_02930 [Planctomycetota bacterium]